MNRSPGGVCSLLEGGAFTQCWLRQRLGPGGPCGRPQTDAAPGPFNFAVVFNRRMPPCQGGACARPPSGCDSRQPHESSYRLRVSTRPSLQNSAHSGRHGGSLPFSFGVVADKQCTCPASKLMWERYPPTPPFHAADSQIAIGKIPLQSIGLRECMGLV